METTADRFRRRLPARAREVIICSLAEYASPSEVARTVEQETGHVIAPQTVRHYQRHPKWQPEIERERRVLEAQLDRIPIASKFWRQTQRMELLEQARREPDADLGAARGLLLDAAKEMGDLQPKEPVLSSTRIDVRILEQVLTLPPDALAEFARTGRVHPSAYLTDVNPPKPGEWPPAEPSRVDAGDAPQPPTEEAGEGV